MEPRDPNYQQRIRERVMGAPFVRQIGLELDDLGPGWCVTALPLRADHHQQDGYAHAGAQATVLDHTAGCAAFTLVGEEEIVLSVEFKINLLRPAVGERLVCRGEVLRPGRGLIVTEARLYAGRMDPAAQAAHAIVTLAVRPDPALQSGAAAP